MSRAAVFLFLALTSLMLVSCSQAGSRMASDVTAGNGEYSLDNLPAIASSENSSLSNGLGLMGVFELQIDPDTSTIQMLPKRASMAGESFVVSAITFFDFFPCPDCISIKRYTFSSDGISVLFNIRHPYKKGNTSLPPSGMNRLDLDLFDLALVVYPFTRTKTHYNLTNQDVYTGVISNADGYTRDLSQVIINNAAMPYVLATDDSERVPPLNKFNRFAMGDQRDFEVSFDLSNHQTLKFELYVTFGYGVSAKFDTRLTPTYYIPEFNRKAAWRVEVTPPNGNYPPSLTNTWNDTNSTTPRDVKVKVYDWQIGANVNSNMTNITDIRENSNVSSVSVEIPGMNSTIQTVSGNSYAPGGTGLATAPLVYTIPITNSNLLPPGQYIGLVKVLDVRVPKQTAEFSQGYDYLIHSPDSVWLYTFAIPEFATYQTFVATVMDN